MYAWEVRRLHSSLVRYRFLSLEVKKLLEIICLKLQ